MVANGPARGLRIFEVRNMSFFKWSKTANSNAAADPTINWAEG